VGGGVGVEVTGAAPGLGAVDLLEVAQRLAVVGDQDQVHGQGLALAAQGLGQVALEGAVDAAWQFGKGRQGGQQGIVGGGVRRGIKQGSTGGGQGSDAAGSVEEDGPQDAGAALGSVVGQADMLLDTPGGTGMDVLGG